MRPAHHFPLVLLLIAFAACSATPDDSDGSGGTGATGGGSPTGGATQAGGTTNGSGGEDGAITGGASGGGTAGASGGTNAAGAAGMGGLGGGASCELESYDYCEGRALLTDECPNWSRPGGQTREEYVAECQVQATEHLARTSPCYWRRLVECDLDGCPGGVGCLALAVVEAEPTQGDAEEAAACHAGDADACESWPRGRTAACLSKSEECFVGERALCYSWAVVLPEYRDEVDACLDVECGEFEACRAMALGLAGD